MLETMRVTLPEYMKEDESKTVKKEDGRCQITWPWKDENCKLLQNCDLSLEILKSKQRG